VGGETEMGEHMVFIGGNLVAKMGYARTISDVF